jgi:hypothetical protein
LDGAHQKKRSHIDITFGGEAPYGINIKQWYNICTSYAGDVLLSSMDSKSVLQAMNYELILLFFVSTIIFVD